MPLPYQTGNRVYLNGVPLMLYRDADGPQMWSVESVAADAQDLQPFTQEIGWGAWGVGQSVDVGIPHQIHYSDKMNHWEEFSTLKPGEQINTISLGYTRPISVIRSGRPGPTTTAERAPTATSTDNGNGGTLDWANASRITADDGSNTTLTALGSGASSYYLKGDTFGFTTGTVPSTATILGIRVRIQYSVDAAPDPNANLLVRVMKGGVPSSTTYTISMGSTSIIDVYAGSESELWGYSWSPSDIHASGFGVALYVNNASVAARDVNIDYVAIAVTYGLSGRNVYFGSGNKLNKQIMTVSGGQPSFTSTNTRTFTHGTTTGEPTITDMLIFKEQPYNSAASTLGNGVALVAFGADAPMQQMHQMTYTGSDTWKNSPFFPTAGATAYGGVLAVAPSATGAALLWKSTGLDGQNSGPFCRLESMAITYAAADYDVASSWSGTAASSFYQVGSTNTAITDLFVYQRGLGASKPEAAFAFDSDFVAYEKFSMAPYASDQNGTCTTPWGEVLLINHIQGLSQIPTRNGDADIGITTLVSNRSAIRGYISSIATFGPKWVFVAVWTGADSYIMRLKRTKGEQVPHEYLWYPIVKMTGAKVQPQAMHICTFNDVTVLLYGSYNGSTYDVSYITLDPFTSRRATTTGGTWYSPIYGDAKARTLLDELSGYAENCTTDNKFVFYIAWDEDIEADSYTLIGSVETAGAFTLNFDTTLSNHQGNFFRIRISYTGTTNWPDSTSPKLSMSGFKLRGHKQPDQVQQITMQVVASNDDNAGGIFGRSNAGHISTLEALVDAGAVQLIHRDLYGDDSPRMVTVKSVQPRPGRGDGELPPPLVATIVMTRLEATTA